MPLSTHLYGHWQYCFRSYRIFTYTDLIFVACAAGDVELVQNSCAKGQATPYDTTYRGWTLLHVIYNFKSRLAVMNSDILLG